MAAREIVLARRCPWPQQTCCQPGGWRGLPRAIQPFVPVFVLACELQRQTSRKTEWIRGLPGPLLAFSLVNALLLAVTVGLSSFAHADFVPIALTSASYNQDMVVEKTAPAPVVPGGYTTASMDSGLGNSSTSWYEQGYNSASPATGLPAAGVTFT